MPLLKFSSRKNAQGATLPEVIVGAAIFAVLALVVSLFQRDVFSFNRILSESLGNQQEARQAFKSMSAEIRAASQSSLGGYAIEAAATSSLIMYTNIDADSVKERVRYFLSGSTLYKGVIKPVGNPLVYNSANEVLTEIVHNVANATSTPTPIFTYYDSAYDGTTAPLGNPVSILSIRLIRMTVFIDQNPLRDPGPTVITTQAAIRNLKSNL